MSEVHQLPGLFSPWFWRFRRARRPRVVEMLLMWWWVVAVMLLMMRRIIVPPLLMLLRSPPVLVGRDDSGEDRVDRF